MKLLESPYYAAFITGCYIAIFYITNNISMLSLDSQLFIGVIFTIPLIGLVKMLNITQKYMSSKIKIHFILIFISTLVLLFCLRRPVLEITLIQENIDLISPTISTAAKLIYPLFSVILALVFGQIFKNHLKIYSVILSTMALTALIGGLIPVDRTRDSNPMGDPGSGLTTISELPLLSQKPNIYLILSDGFGSFSYLNKRGIDVNDFRKKLMAKNFSLYDDTLSNYQPTTASMYSMLDMKHHYYKESLKFSEITKTGRIRISGNNNLVSYFKRNAYQIEYIHQGSYLLLHGCRADYCFPDTGFAGAKEVLAAGLPGFLRTESTPRNIMPFGKLHEKVVERVRQIRDSGKPVLQYIHSFDPAHGPFELAGRCNEQKQFDLYKDRVLDTAARLIDLIEDVVALDPDAVMVLAGDHGPMISGRCRPLFDANKIDDYLDRAGVIMAIRWPDDYTGQFDSRIKTSVNIFRYLINALTEKGDDDISGLADEDVYIKGTKQVLKVVDDGVFLVPPIPLSE